MSVRPTIDEYYIEMVKLVASRGTCLRRKVGCILVDDKNRLISCGYNGGAPGAHHCIDAPCGGHLSAPGTNLSACRSSHAEQSALLYCPDVLKIKTAYVTASPCTECTKLLLLTSCQRVVFIDEYPQPLAKQWWLEAGREWVHFKPQ